VVVFNSDAIEDSAKHSMPVSSKRRQGDTSNEQKKSGVLEASESNSDDDNDGNAHKRRLHLLQPDELAHQHNGLGLVLVLVCRPTLALCTPHSPRLRQTKQETYQGTDRRRHRGTCGASESDRDRADPPSRCRTARPRSRA